MSVTRPVTRHGAKFSDNVLGILHLIHQEFDLYDMTVLDPMGGVGRVQRVWPDAIVGELEMPWLEQADPPFRVQQDVHFLPYRNDSIDVVATSPTYDNRYADHHIPRDTSIRHSYTFWLRDTGHEPHANNSGLLHFGPDYKKFHWVVYGEIHRVLTLGGLFILNVSNFIRQFGVVEASLWHADTAAHMFGAPIRWYQVDTPRMRQGANHKLRVERRGHLCLPKAYQRL